MTAMTLEPATVRRATHALLTETAQMIEDDDMPVDLGLLETGTEMMCELFDIPPDTADQILRHALYWITRAQGHDLTAGTDEPVAQDGLNQLEKAPQGQQVEILRQAALDLTCSPLTDQPSHPAPLPPSGGEQEAQPVTA